MHERDKEPPDLQPERGMHLARGESRVPVGRGLHARGPCGVELRAERPCFARGVEFPEVGGLEGALVAEDLESTECEQERSPIRDGRRSMQAR